MQVLQASHLRLHDVQTKFGLQETRATDFFLEWQVNRLPLSEVERYWLDKAQNSIRYLSAYPLREELVKMVVLSPVLSVAGFYEHSFRTEAERTVDIEVEGDDEDVIRGRIDVLVLNENIWVTTVESKGSQFNWRLGLPQALCYMMGDTSESSLRYGLVTNGGEIVFIKLVPEQKRYGLSRVFSVSNPGNELYDVVSVLRAIQSL